MQAALRQKCSTRGFTMVETLMALIIVALAIGSLSIVTQSHWRTTSYMRDQTFAHWVAMNQAAELQLQSVAPSVGSKKSSDELLDVTWEVVTVTTATPNEYIRRIDIEVFEPNTDAEEPLAIVSLFLPTLDPSNLGPALQAAAENAAP